MNKKLTLNLGLRYDYIGPSTPAFPGGGVNFDPFTGNLLLSGLGQVSRSANIQSNLKNFEPRVGFAYRVLSNTVIRGGFGRAYFSSNYGGGVFGTLCCSFPVQTREDIGQVNSYFPIILPGQSSNLVLNPNQAIPPAPAATLPSSGLLPLPQGLGAFYIPTHDPNSYVDSWNFTVERQVAPNFVVSLAYVGNVGRHIYQSWDYNAPIPGPGDVNSRRPLDYLGIDTSVSQRCGCSNSSYNALQFVVKKQVSMGYSIQSSFTLVQGSRPALLVDFPEAPSTPMTGMPPMLRTIIIAPSSGRLRISGICLTVKACTGARMLEERSRRYSADGSLTVLRV